MVKLKRILRTGLVLVAAGFAVSSPGLGQEDDETQLLLRREIQAGARIEKLTKEQDKLLYRKALAAADSKYLVLDLRGGKGLLKYRNRILRSFEFPGIIRTASSLVSSGVVTLVRKIDGTPGKRQLVFNEPLVIIQSRYAAVKDEGKQAIRITIGTIDLNAIFYALEPGSMVVLM